MKVYIDVDEVYPAAFLTHSDRFATEVEVDGRKLARWRRVLKEWAEVQTEMLAAAEVEQ